MQKLKTRLEAATGQKVVSQTNSKIDNSISFKAHVKSLNGMELIDLAKIQSDFPKAIMEAKRSGTGITVIVTVKEG